MTEHTQSTPISYSITQIFLRPLAANSYTYPEPIETVRAALVEVTWDVPQHPPLSRPVLNFVYCMARDLVFVYDAGCILSYVSRFTTHRCLVLGGAT